jgi:hypothetical protein
VSDALFGVVTETATTSTSASQASEPWCVTILRRARYRRLRAAWAKRPLRLIDGWIEDYNEIHPHSALKMASPRQFIRAKSN